VWLNPNKKIYKLSQITKNMLNKKNYKKYSEKIKKAARGTVKLVEKYGPRVHSGLQRTSQATMFALTPVPSRGKYVDISRPITMGPKKKRVAGRIRKAKKGRNFYLDFT